MNVKCPVCKKITTWEGNPYRPFCSYRCKMIDLDKWIREEYRIPDYNTNVKKNVDENKKD
ncbi:MAG: DNA gyrase inhibitor YacG [bacterium]